LISPYIRQFEARLGLPELRILAKALAKAGRFDESISLVSRYMSRENYKISREDLELFYPRHFLELIEKNARDVGLGPELLFGLVRTESSFMPQVISRSGAVGLTQLMEPTALDMAGRIARRDEPDYRIEGTVELKNPEANVHIGAFYLNYLIDQMGSPMMALLAYNGGMGRLRRWRAADRETRNLPEDLFLESIEYAETREYGRRTLGAAAVYGFLYYNKSMEAVAAGIYR
jgi:soluble lytic murein transglycosylase